MQRQLPERPVVYFLSAVKPESCFLAKKDKTEPNSTEMVKQKPAGVRTYDQDGFRRRAACLCVKDNSESEVLLVSGSRNPGRWVVPGGGIEPTDQDASIAAVREVHEEAGVTGCLGRCLGIFENKERKTRTEVFVMIVEELLEDWDDAKEMGRRRKWHTFNDAKIQLGLHKPVQMSYLELLQKPKRVL